jgi:hypothetical protein
MIDFDRRKYEEVISLQEAARIVADLQGGGRSPCHSTLWRWGAKGLCGARLEMWRIGHKWLTSKEAINRFLRVTQGRRDEPRALMTSSPPTKPSPTVGSPEQIASAKQVLEKFTGGDSSARGSRRSGVSVKV